MMMFDSIYRFLEETVGFDSESTVRIVTNSIIENTLSELEIYNENEYLQLIKTSSIQFQSLLDKIFNNESYFLKDQSTFNILKQIVNEQKEFPKNGINILSIPCGSGEEPYSIAITLLELGVKTNDFLIDAIDINSNLIEIAKQAVFQKNSIKELNTVLIEKYFNIAEELFILKPKVANLVDFETENILKLNGFQNQKKYDIIFCKNIMIYLIPSAQIRIINYIKSILNTNATVITTTTESTFFMENGFEDLKYEPRCAFRLIVDKTKPLDKANRKKTLKEKFTHFPLTLRSINKKVSDNDSNEIISHSQTTSLKHIQKLYESGKFQDALSYCIDYNSNFQNDPNGYYTMGLIFEALNEIDKAEEFFHKALYLEPYHFETLIHLVRLFENKGWKDRANLLKRRIDKITGKYK